MALTKVAIRMGKLPAVWIWASGVVIRKLGKYNYTKLKAYRSISLLRDMGNVVEKLVAERLSAVLCGVRCPESLY